MEPIPVFKEKKAISPVWTLPIIALCICAWIVYTSYQNAGVPITVYFEDASGLTPGKTQVIARGVPIGTVTKLLPDLGKRRVKTMIKMDKSAADMLVSDTQFWIVRPEISAASVQGLDTLFSGSYIAIQPGISDEEKKEFLGQSTAPPIQKDTPGLHISLQAEQLGSIQNGSEVYYRNVTIGTVTNHSLNQQTDSIVIDLYIKPQYSHLVKEGSRFCNASGITIQGKLTNLKVQVESLSSLIKGGIVLQTPEDLSDTRPVSNGHVFTLYKDLDSARYGIKMYLQLASSRGIYEGETQIIYRGLVAGVVEKISFNNDSEQLVTAEIMLDPRAEPILRDTTKFWMVTPEFSSDRVENLDLLLSGPYITFKPGTGPFRDHFEILVEPPPQKPLRPGLEVQLKAEESYSLERGAPVMYKSKKVGEVLNTEIDSSLQGFAISVFIYEPYEKLVRSNSVFWRDGGVSLEASLQGVNFQANSLSSVIRGGISFVTPENTKSKGAVDLQKRPLPIYASYADAVEKSPHLKESGYRFQLITESPDTYERGTPIYYKKIKVGKVTGLRLSKDNRYVLLDCLIDEDYATTVNSSSRFYDMSGISVEGSLSGVSMETGPLHTLVIGGLGYFTPDQKATRNNASTYPLYISKKAAEAVDKVSVSVKFKDIGDLREGSPVKFKGVEIGSVSKLSFAKNMSDVMVTLLIDRQAGTFFREKTRIWLEVTEVSLSGVKNMKNILFGSYINILPGSGSQKRSFTALLNPPAAPADDHEGFKVTLTSKHLGSLKIDSPVYYRQIQVGKVINYQLSDTFEEVHIFLNIDPPYAALIRQNTRFWKASGTKISGGLFSGLTISTESLESLLTGGIALATPDNSKMGGKVRENQFFELHEEAKEEWLDWQPTITLIDKETGKDSSSLIKHNQ